MAFMPILAWANKPNASGPMLLQTDKQPPVFENINPAKKQSTIISVYFLGHFVSNVQAQYNNASVWITYPGRLVGDLAHLQPGAGEAIEKGLQGDLDINAQALCKSGSADNQPYCEPLSPKVVGLIFNAATFRADLFINSKYMKVEEEQQLTLPPAQGGMATINQLSSSVGGDSSDTSIGLFDVGQIGYHSTHLAYNFSVSQYRMAGGKTETQSSLGSFYLQTVKNELTYSVGMMGSPGSNMLSGQQVLGFSMTNHNQLMQQISGTPGSPVVVYLLTRSQVMVYQASSGVLVYSAILPAGRQSLDTRSFPVGSYQVKVTITDQMGQKSSQVYPFSKSEGVVQGNVNVTFTTGLLRYQSASEDLNESTLHTPVFSTQPFAELDLGKALGLGLTGKASLLSDFNKSYGSLGLNLQKTHFDVQPSIVLGGDGDFGFSTSMNGTVNDLGLESNVLWLFGHQDQDSSASESHADYDFTPFSGAYFNASLGADYSFDGFYLSVNQNWTQDKSQTGTPMIKNRSVTVSRGVDFGHSIQGGISFSEMQSEDTDGNKDSVVSLSLNLGFNTPVLDVSVAFGSAVVRHNDEPEVKGSTENYSLSRNDQWGHVFMNNRLEYNKIPESSSLNYSLDFTSPFLTTRWSVLRSNNASSGSGYSNTTYSGMLQSTFAYAQSYGAFGYNSGAFASALVHINSIEPARVQVFVDSQLRLVVRTGQTYALFLEPYKVHLIRIVPLGSENFKYNTTPKRVVLYSGNAIGLSWSLEKQQLLFMQIVNSKGKPMPDLLYQAGSEFATTVSDGYLQASVVTSQQSIKLYEVDGKSCIIPLPKLDRHLSLVVLKKPLVCHLKAKKVEAKKPQNKSTRLS